MAILLTDGFFSSRVGEVIDFMLKIRLKRTGRTRQPFYRIVVAEASRSPQSSCIEIVGSFNPRDKKGSLVLKAERIKYWLSQGAKATGVAHNMLVTAGIVTGRKKKVTKIAKKKKEGEETSKVKPKKT